MQTLKFLLQGNTLFMDKISSWEDPYENFFLKSKFMLDGFNVDAREHVKGLFGQSWTCIQSSDAMWRIYSQDKNGVCIKTNAYKLFKTIYIDDQCMTNTWYGNVKYGTMDDIKKK